jgi:acetylornithine deacetylase
MSCVGQEQPAGVVYFCDASVLSEGGIPSLVFGPGDIAQAHTADEWIALSQLQSATDILNKYLTSLP